MPQDSVLGPLLFLVYVNEVTNQVSPDSKTVLFADDIALYRTIVSPADYSSLQSDINFIADWIESNHLSLHTGKCCAMLFSRKCTLRITPDHALTVQGSTLKFVDQYKYLSLLFCSGLVTLMMFATRQGD